MTTTPPVLQRATTPPTPRFAPSFESPYALRKSTRIANQRVARTPSPTGIGSSVDSSHHKQASLAGSIAHTLSPPSSPQSSLRMSRRMRHVDQNDDKGNDLEVLAHGPSHTLGMLPTPSKTPRKKVIRNDFSSTARILFPTRPNAIEDAMPAPRRDGRKGRSSTKLGLGSFGDIDDNVSEAKVDIFTDYQDRIPEVDESEDNPFYTKPATEPIRLTRSSKRKREFDPAITQAVHYQIERNEGMFFVKRGMKVYRKFTDTDPPTPTRIHRAQLDLLSAVPSSPTSLPRAAIQPRRLFPSAPGTTTDEEAVTDIEYPEKHGMSKKRTGRASTPSKPSVGLTSPPATKRTTRFMAKRHVYTSAHESNDEDEEVVILKSPKPRKIPINSSTTTCTTRLMSKHVDQSASDEDGGVIVPKAKHGPPKLKKSGSGSPFDSWSRVKPGASATSYRKKRGGDDLEKTEEGKRVKHTHA